MGQSPEEQATYRPAEDIDRRYLIEQMTIEVGWLGKVFGTSAHAPTNISGLILFLFFASIILVLFLEIRMEAIEYLKLVLPVITLALGYLFGKST